MSDLRSQYQQRAHAAALRRLARPQSQYAQRDGTGVIVNGNPIRAQKVSNEALASGDTVALSGDSGVGQQESRVVRRPQRIEARPKVLKGEVIVLASDVQDGQKRFWIGGDRKTPYLVASIPDQASSAMLELTGPGQFDWLVTLTYGTTARVIYGNGSGWTVTDPRVGLVNYKGNAFFNGDNVLYGNPGVFQDEDFVLAPSLTSLSDALGTVQGSGCHNEVGGLTTIALAYCESYSIVGPTNLSGSGHNHRTGLVPGSGPLTFTGTNTYIFDYQSSANWEGAVQGPGYLGPGGEACQPGDPGYSGTELRPRKRASSSSTTSRAYATQTYSVSLSGGGIAVSQGTDTLSYSGGSSFETLAAVGGIKRLEYSGSCELYTNPNAYRYTILGSGGDSWDFIPASGGSTTGAINVSSFNDVAIAPGITKTNRIDGSRGSTGPATATKTTNWTNMLFPAGDGVFYSERIDSGLCTIDLIDGLINSPPRQSSKVFMRFNGGTYEVSGGQAGIDATYQLDTANSLPKFNTTYITSGNEAIIWTKPAEAEVNRSKAAIVAGKVEFYAFGNTVYKKVLPIPLTGQDRKVLISKYWEPEQV